MRPIFVKAPKKKSLDDSLLERVKTGTLRTRIQNIMVKAGVSDIYNAGVLRSAAASMMVDAARAATFAKHYYRDIDRPYNLRDWVPPEDTLACYVRAGFLLSFDDGEGYESP